MHQILIVEDNSRLLLNIKSELISHQRKFYLVKSVHQAIKLIDKNYFNLAIVDICLPDGSGFEIVDYLDQYSYQTKVLVLSQKNSAKCKVRGLDVGADDYLTKPFTPKELQLRVEKLLLKHKLVAQKRIVTDGISFCVNSGLVIVSDQVIKLSKKEADIFKILLINRNQVISKQKIINQIWTGLDSKPCHNTVEVYIRRLRMKLKPVSKHLQTVRNFGYCWNSKGK